jgi:hypothetical protein
MPPAGFKPTISAGERPPGTECQFTLGNVSSPHALEEPETVHTEVTEGHITYISFVMTCIFRPCKLALREGKDTDRKLPECTLTSADLLRRIKMLINSAACSVVRISTVSTVQCCTFSRVCRRVLVVAESAFSSVVSALLSVRVSCVSAAPAGGFPWSFILGTCMTIYRENQELGEMGPIDRPETSLTNFCSTLRKTP